MGLEQEVAQGRAEKKWGSCTLFIGGWKEPRPKPCPACGGRYKALVISSKGRTLGTCTLKHGVFRWPGH
jgi:hypothetical protein